MLYNQGRQSVGGGGGVGQWCIRKYLGTGAVQNISSVIFLEREH